MVTHGESWLDKYLSGVDPSNVPMEQSDLQSKDSESRMDLHKSRDSLS
jgi:hypothetical protein